MFEAMTWASKNGSGETPKASAIRNITGTISITVVTLSRKAERKAVTRLSRIKICVETRYLLLSRIILVLPNGFSEASLSVPPSSK